MFERFFRNMPPVTKNVLILCVLVFVAGNFVPSLGARIEQWCALYSVESPGFGAWQLVTYIFLHGGFAHLFFNMFALVMFGSIIEWTMGSRRYLVYFLSCGIGAALFQLGVNWLQLNHYHEIVGGDFYRIIARSWEYWQQGLISQDPTLAKIAMLTCVPTVGASGSIYGILLAFGMLYPNREMYIMFIPVPVKAKWMVIGYGAIELLMGVTGAGDGVAHFAHLGGMLFGLLLLLYWKKRGDFRGWY